MKTNKGFSLVEMMIAVGLTAVLGLSGYSLYNYSKKNTDRLQDDIQTTITRLGASSIIKRDLSAAEMSFNFLNIVDDKGLPFFTLSKHQYCKHNACERELTLSVPEGGKTSKAMYFIVRKSLLNETQKLTIHPRSVFSGTKYAGINWQYNSPMYSLSRTHFPLTSWEEKRLMLVSSETDFFDCNLSSKSNSSLNCQIDCSIPGTCDFTIKRPFKFLGTVESNLVDLQEVVVDNSSALLLRNYNVCRPNKNNGCASYIKANVVSSKILYEQLPYTPGADDRTSIYYVDIVKYYLERGDDNNIYLMRSLGSVDGGRVKFNNGIKIMSGLKALVFNRANISNPSIEYRFITTQGKRISNL